MRSNITVSLTLKRQFFFTTALKDLCSFGKTDYFVFTTCPCPCPQCPLNLFQKLVTHNKDFHSHQVIMCQQLPPRQALSAMLGAMLELWPKSATLRDSVAILHRMGEVFTTRSDRKVKPMSTQTEQSSAAVRRR